MLAPMGGGPSTPELVAAVSGAGGLGWLAGAYLSPRQILEQVAEVRRRTYRPFGINLFTGGWSCDAGAADIGPMLELLRVAHERLGIEPPALPEIPEDPFPAQLAAVLEARPAAFSFTFGIPVASEIKALRSAGIMVFGTATTVSEALLLTRAEVDAIVAQGEEAGAHRGTFELSFEDSLVTTLDLTRAAADTTGLPVVAAGGLMNGADIARVLAAGAAAGLLGTAFLTCPECGAAPAHKEAVLAARTDTTTLTRAFSGRPARGLRNGFIVAVDGEGAPIPPYPFQNALTRPMRNAASARGLADYLSLWAGRGVCRARAPMPAKDLTRVLADELHAALI